MKIKILLNKKSIQSAIKAIETAKTQLENEMLDDFLKRCYSWFLRRSSEYLNASTIGENVKSDIDNGWRYERTTNGAKFINSSEKAVYVEFGVGIVGQESPHKEANALGNKYKYNIGTKIRSDNSWIFNPVDDGDIDIEEERIMIRTEHTVRTQGSPAIMYAFNAFCDLKIEIPKIWKNIKKEYWG